MTQPPFPDAPDGRPRPPPPTLLMQPLARLLRPLVRLLIRSGITFPLLADMLRGLYVEVTANDLQAAGTTATNSRISLLTGVHRKEIRRQRAPGTSSNPPEVVTLNSEIIARWLGLPDYVDAAHQPLALPRMGPAPSFEALVGSITHDLRARTVLDDWLDQGIAVLDADDRVRLNVAAFIPRKGQEAQLFYFARNLHDHIAAACANVTSDGTAPFLDRSVHYDHLSTLAAARLETVGREAAQHLLLDINRIALEIADADTKDPTGHDGSDPCQAPASSKRRVNLGVYLYVEDEQPVAEN